MRGRSWPHPYRAGSSTSAATRRAAGRRVPHARRSSPPGRRISDSLGRRRRRGGGRPLAVAGVAAERASSRRRGAEAGANDSRDRTGWLGRSRTSTPCSFVPPSWSRRHAKERLRHACGVPDVARHARLPGPGGSLHAGVRRHPWCAQASGRRDLGPGPAAGLPRDRVCRPAREAGCASPHLAARGLAPVDAAGLASDDVNGPASSCRSGRSPEGPPRGHRVARARPFGMHGRVTRRSLR